MTTRFLSNEGLWREIRNRTAKAKKIQAAIAYLGTGGADLVDLGRGDTLLVDMSMEAVKQGATNPREVRRLIRRGVRVFSRGSLHAKFLIVGNALIVSSANVSKNSMQRLDEAGVLTSDPAAIRRARDFMARMCTEPVRLEYLNECIAAYKPPWFKAFAGRKRKPTRHLRAAKLWFIGGLTYGDVPQREQETVESLKNRVAKRHKLLPESIGETHYPSKRKYFAALRPKEDWVVECVLDSEAGRRFVEAPARLLDVVSYPRGHGKKRWVLMLDQATNAESMPLRGFRSRVREHAPELDKEKPQTCAIENDESADEILRFWTHSGRIAKRR